MPRTTYRLSAKQTSYKIIVDINQKPEPIID